MTSIIIIAILLLVAIIVFIYVAYWRIFEKAGKPGWACLIPFYNAIILLEIIGKPWWWLFFLLIPGANIIFAVLMTHYLSKSFAQSEGFTVGLIFLPFIFYPILGYGDAEYIGPAGVYED
ncbi:MAG TPA: DUF5684 domain-containing protein [Saprospiraceae bacterium]|nr:DUF5684 domain-containing protein [Saprospiraceae bacterium]HQW55058.1 DUF5684 domain-containing protein [Saprospiraceae bacterium]